MKTMRVGDDVVISPIPISLRKANDFVEQFHRHSKRTVRDGGKFAIGCTDGASLVGVAIVGNPLSATYMDGLTAEILRVCVVPDAPKNVPSFLYGACWRACRAMGFQKLITYTLQSESGASLKAAGFKIVGEVAPHNRWAGKSEKDLIHRKYQSLYGQAKFRWEMDELSA